jgi:hypothetical protein
MGLMSVLAGGLRMFQQCRRLSVVRLTFITCALNALAACSEPAVIEDNCTTNGRGDVSCEFHNKSKYEGSKCVQIQLKNKRMSSQGILSSREICSGIVKGGDIVQRETSGGFQIQPSDFCIWINESWTDTCEMDVIEKASSD